jgi:inosine/xanthosine triphosphatase
MQVRRIAVASTRRPKLLAVQEAVQQFRSLFDPPLTIEVFGYDVASGVSHTPVSREELMRGARQRAETLAQHLQDSVIQADFYVGLEGGLDSISGNGNRRVFLQSWAYAMDSHRGHFGCSGSVELPAALAAEVLDRGTELATAIDQFTNSVGTRDNQGAWGVLSGGLISRQDSFRFALLAAFAPFYNVNLYRLASAAAS